VMVPDLEPLKTVKVMSDIVGCDLDCYLLGG